MIHILSDLKLFLGRREHTVTGLAAKYGRCLEYELICFLVTTKEQRVCPSIPIILLVFK